MLKEGCAVAWGLCGPSGKQDIKDHSLDRELMSTRLSSIPLSLTLLLYLPVEKIHLKKGMCMIGYQTMLGCLCAQCRLVVHQHKWNKTTPKEAGFESNACFIFQFIYSTHLFYPTLGWFL